MSAHKGCFKCVSRELAIRERQNRIRELLRTIEKYPGTPKAKGCKTQIIQLKADILETRQIIEQHSRETQDEEAQVQH